MLRRVCKVLGLKADSWADADGKWIGDQGNTVPTDALAGYGVGALFQHRDGAAGDTLYVNEGSETSCDFNKVLTASNILPGDMAVGAGISGGTGTVCEHMVYKVGGLYKTEIYLDLTGLTSSATDGDIIGVDDTGVAYIGQITAAVNGTIVSGRITCLEAPTTGDDDIAIYSATEATGVEDAGIASLAETLLLDHGAWSLNDVASLTGIPAANEYLYLVAKGGDTAGTYDAGKLLIELWGV